jgi:hypothetical protein
MGYKGAVLPRKWLAKRVFIAHSKQDHQTLAYELAIKLRTQDLEAFYDDDSLPRGEAYDELIRKAIECANVFVFLAGRHSVTQGSYALTELEIAKRRWSNPSGRVLPVILTGTDMSQLDPYLREGVTVLKPRGNVATEAAAEVQEMLAKQRSAVLALFIAGAVLLTGTLIAFGPAGMAAISALATGTGTRSQKAPASAGGGNAISVGVDSAIEAGGLATSQAGALSPPAPTISEPISKSAGAQKKGGASSKQGHGRDYAKWITVGGPWSCKQVGLEAPRQLGGAWTIRTRCDCPDGQSLFEEFLYDHNFEQPTQDTISRSFERMSKKCAR